MWGAWFVAGLLLLITKRYAKKTWNFSHIAHALLGFLVVSITMIFAFKVTSWAPFDGIHNALGTLTVICAILVGLSGSFTSGTQRFYNGDKPWSEKERAEKIAKIHRISGYIMLLIGNLCVMTGLGYYFNGRLQGDSRSALGILSMMVFLVLVGIMEAIYRIRNRYSMEPVGTPQPSFDGKIRTYTPQMVDKNAAEGRELVVFDNLVLDLNGYHRMHPGGKFNLTHNYGRDITKFFIGGYQMVNKQGKWPHTHSKFALDIVKSLVVGVLDGQTLVREELFRLTSKSPVNQGTATFTFTTVDNEPVVNCKNWYGDPAMVGRHFLVYCVRTPNVKRQYTICSSIQPHMYAELIKMAD